MKYFKLKFLLLFFALAAAIPPAWAANVTDVLTATDLGVTTSSYTTFSDVTITNGSGAVYAGKYANNNGAIQLNSSETGNAAYSGIVSTGSGGTIKSITLTFNTLQTSTKSVLVYGKNTAYTVNDLYTNSTNGTRGTLLQTISSYGNLSTGTPTKYTITGDYQYIGIRANSGAVYLDKIEIEWATPEDYAAELTSGTSLNVGKTGPNIPITKNVTIKNTGLNPITPMVSINGAGFSTTYTPATVAKGATATIPVVFNPTTTGTFEGTMHIGAQESEDISLNVDLTGICAYELTVGNGNSSSSYLPVYGNWFDSDYQINQMLYPAWMMEDLNGKTIKSMTFYAPAGLKFYNGTVTFKLASIDAETPYYTSTPYHKDADFKTVCVYSVPTTQTDAQKITEWNIYFNEDFNFTGGSLLIEVYTEGTGYGSTSFSGDDYSPDNLSYYSYINYSGNLAEEKTTFLPKVTFGYEAAPVVVPDPELVVDPEELTMTAVAGKTATATFDVLGTDLKGDITITVEGAGFTVDPNTITKDAAEEGATVTVTYAPTAVGNHTATITVSSEDAEDATVAVTGTATAPEIAAITFSPEAGSYTEYKTVTISCATDDAELTYSTDGGQNWQRNRGSVTVNVDRDMTLMAKAVVAGVEKTATAVYSFEIPEDPITMDALEGYYFIKNNGNNQYANVVGRKTLRFTETPDAEAGTVIYVKTNTNGQVQSLRSQAADLQGYANKAMGYVPDFVHLVAQKLELEGVGQLFGENGVDAILDKFNACFDYHLYVEPVDGGYRIYGKTPSMQPVVEFYRENQAKCDAKLPGLEDAINNAIDKILEKTNGSGASILEHFSLHTIWEKMNDANLIEPTDDASTLAFYHQVLMNKDYVWSFAYETAMIYWTNLKNHQRYETEIKPQLGEFADYIDKIEQVRPNFKYYIAQKDNKPDFISEGNGDIDAARNIWTVEPRTTFTVNFPEENLVKDEYVTTLYTDFAYDLPDGVTAYKVINVIDGGIAQLAAVGNNVPAQTPVLLKSTTAGDIVLTLNVNNGTPISGNLLKGPNYLIGKYQLKAESVAKLFNLVKGLFGEEIYNRYMLDYEHLMIRYSGMVNNKYFWGLSNDDLKLCGTTDEYGRVQCVVRSLDVEDGEVAFYDNMTVETNKAFLVSEEHEKITFAMKDINRDGKISIGDVTALIDILLTNPSTLALAEPTAEYPRGLDYEAADFDGNGDISIHDVSELIDFLLMWYPEPDEEDGE